MSDTKETVIGIFAESTGSEPATLDASQSLEDLEIDSLEFLSIMQDVEARCGVKIPSSEYTEAQTIGDVIALASRKAAA